MWVWFLPKVHMTCVIIAFYILMCSVSAFNQSVMREAKKSLLPQFEGEMSFIPVKNNSKTENILLKKMDVYKPLQSNLSSLSDQMKDFINFIDLRARGKNNQVEKNEGSELIVDLDQTKVDILGKIPKEATIFTKKLTEEGMIVDIPKSSLFHKKRSNIFKKFRKSKIPSELRLFYKTSTPMFRQSQREFMTTKLLDKMYKAFIYPLKKIAKHNNHRPKSMKRSINSLKPIGIFNVGDQNVPKICHASHQPYQWTLNSMNYFRRPKKISNKSLGVSLDRRDHRSTSNSHQTSKKSAEISESALFQIINQLIQDSVEKKTVDSIELNIPTSKMVLNVTRPVDSNLKIKSKGNVQSISTIDDNFNVAIIIAKITHEPVHSSYTATISTTPNTVYYSKKWRNEKKANSFVNETTFKPVTEVGKKHREKCERNDNESVRCNNSNNVKSKMENNQDNKSTQNHSKEGLNNLLKEIIKHVSIALEAVTTSKEFLDLISCSSAICQSIDVTESGPTKHHTESTMHNETSFDDCFEEGKSSGTKSSDNGLTSEVGSSSLNSTMPQSSVGVTDSCLKNDYTSERNNLQCANISENTTTSTECSVFLDEEEDYFEGFKTTENSRFLILPEDAPVVEDCQTANYNLKKSNIASSLKIKRKNNVTNGTEDPDGSRVYEAKELMKELDSYHMMLQDPIVTRIWPFFEVTTCKSNSQLSFCSPLNKIKKRKSKINMRVHKSLQNNFQLDGSGIESRSHKEHEDGSRSHIGKVSSDIDNILNKFNMWSYKSNINGFRRKKQQDSVKMIKISDHGNIRVPESIKINYNTNLEKNERLTNVVKIPPCWEKKSKMVREKNKCCSRSKQNENTRDRWDYNQDVVHRLSLSDAKRRGWLAQVVSRLNSCPTTTPYNLPQLPSIPNSGGSSYCLF